MEWMARARMPTARFGLAAVLGRDRQIYAIGGHGASQPSTVLSTVEVYDPRADAWDQRSPMPTARYGLAAVRGGQGDALVYAIGGYNALLEPGVSASLATVEVYDPASDSWEAATPMPTARNFLALGVVGRRIYAFGGVDVDGHTISKVEVFEPDSATWEPVAPMPTPRQQAAAVTDGEMIYVIGGYGIGPGPLATVERYEPATDSWSSLAPLPTARGGLAAVAAPRGLLHAIGGLGSGGYLVTVETYDVDSGTWESSPPMPTARHQLAGVWGPDGMSYAIGGFNGSYVDAVEALSHDLRIDDPAVESPEDGEAASQRGQRGTASPPRERGTESPAGQRGTESPPSRELKGWHAGALMARARHGLGAATAPDGRIYAVGGDGAIQTTNAKALEIYDASADKWFEGPPMPLHVFNVACRFGPGGNLYVIGLATIPPSWVREVTVLIFDVDAAMWTVSGNVPNVWREGLSAAVAPDGKAYLIGGMAKGAEPPGAVSTVVLYDPSKGIAPVAPMTTARSRAAAVAGHDGSIYVVGGENGSGLLATAELYDPRTGQWSVLAPMPSARADAAAMAGWDGLIYVIGGIGGAGQTAAVEAYDPSTNTWSVLPPMPEPRYRLAAAPGYGGKIYAMGGLTEEKVHQNSRFVHNTLAVYP